MKEAADNVKISKDVPPPNVETYIPSHNGMVLTSPYHGSDEVEENKRIGAFVAKKLERRFIYYQDLTPKAANSHT